MTRITQLGILAGMLAAATAPALAQIDRYDSPYGRPQYDRPYDSPSDRAYDRPPAGTFEGMRTGPTERRQGNVTFMTGGVGRDEAESFRAAMPRYMLGLEFARANVPRGDFLANVDVSVTDERGQPVLQTVSDGPFLLANLPAGRYTVRAASEGRVKTRTVNVAPGRSQYLMFAW